MRLKVGFRRPFVFSLGLLLFLTGYFLFPPSDVPQAEETKKDSLFPVPQTDDATKLLDFIEDVRARRPFRKPQGPAEYRAYVKYHRAAPVAIAEAAEKILAKADNKSPEYVDASAYLLESKVTGFADADEDEQRAAIVKDVKEHLEKYGVRRDEAGVAYGISQALESEESELAAKAYADFAKLIATSEDEEIRELKQLFEGPSRRLNLVGNKMEVFGTTLDGDAFDWEAYTGKVVLIDFWATWCRPCLEEVPNLKKAYEKYHDQGFEIVGVNVDDRKATVEKHLAKDPLPWTQLHQEEEGNKLADYYGVNSLPFIALVGKDGKVITLDPYGPKLHQHLEQVFSAADSGE